MKAFSVLLCVCSAISVFGQPLDNLNNVRTNICFEFYILFQKINNKVNKIIKNRIIHWK